MFNIHSLLGLTNGDGATLKNGELIRHKTGYQVADYGIETTDVEIAMKAIEDMNGNCGIWFEKGIYFIDHSYRVDSKKKALEEGKKYNQISIYDWKNDKLIYC